MDGINIIEEFFKSNIGKLDELKKSSDDEKSTNEEKTRFESIVKFKDFLLIVNKALHKSKNESKDEDESLLDDKKFLVRLESNWEDAETEKSFVFNLLKMRFLFDKYIVKREYTSDYKEGRWSLQKLTQSNGSPEYTLTLRTDIQI